MAKLSKKFNEKVPTTGTVVYYDYIPIQLLCELAIREIRGGERSKVGFVTCSGLNDGR